MTNIRPKRWRVVAVTLVGAGLCLSAASWLDGPAASKPPIADSQRELARGGAAAAEAKAGLRPPRRGPRDVQARDRPRLGGPDDGAETAPADCVIAETVADHRVDLAEPPADVVERVFARDPAARLALAQINERRMQIREAMQRGVAPGAAGSDPMPTRARQAEAWERAGDMLAGLQLPAEQTGLENEYARRRPAAERELLDRLPAWMTDSAAIQRVVAGLSPADRLRFHDALTEKLADWTHASSM